MSKSSIEWTEATWNPIVGCSILSPGCKNCYAMPMAARIEAMNAEARASGKSAAAPQYDGTTHKVNGHTVWTGKLALARDSVLMSPLKRKKPTVYFVNSMGDLFHEAVPDEWIDKVFAVMALCPQHTFQVLTKRAKRMREFFAAGREVLHTRWVWAGRDLLSCYAGGVINGEWPLSNVWLGTSTERQQEANERIRELLRTPAAVRFISAEPLLGPIDLQRIKVDHPAFPGEVSAQMDALVGEVYDRADYPVQSAGGKLDWVIVGGESGPGSRPMHPDWARSLRDQCVAAGVPFFFKQWGAHGPSFSAKPSEGIAFDSSKMVPCSKKSAGRTLDGMIHDEYPGCVR